MISFHKVQRILLACCALRSAVEAWTSTSFRGPAVQSRTSTPLRSTTPLSMNTPILDDWKVLRNGRVQGVVRNHPTIPDGDTITTSPITQPESAARRRTVTTVSGSRYQLGDPMLVEVPSRNGVAKQISMAALQRQARVEKDLTGEVVGDDFKNYLLAGNYKKSTSGKSRIYKAYRADEDGLPVGEPVLVKLSTNYEALDRENENYARITKSGLLKGQFVKLLEFYPVASEITKKFRNMSALVLERGMVDLRQYISTNGPLQGKELRDATAAAAQCLQAVHSSGLVWTDLKTENFIVADDGTVKGIDLESAMPVRDNPVDYSPEATPPEFAKAFLAGDGPYFTLEFNYDLWSFGMLLYELATGKSYFYGKTPVQITKFLKTMEDSDINVEAVPDPKLRDLIQQCLKLDPRARPNILQVLLHPYFLTTGIGPISF